MGIHLSLLGEFSVRLDSREVPEAAFARRKAYSLLKLLALQPGYRLHRYQAMDLLWPDLPPERAAAQLYKAVHHIRQAFATVASGLPPETLLEIRDEVISLKAPGGAYTDVGEFEELAQKAARNGNLALLERAVATYRGDLLPTDLYAEWAAEHRDALRARFLELLVRLGEEYLAAGYLSEAGDVFRQVLAREPIREEAHRGLMRVYAAWDSDARALHQYQLCKDLLVEELGADPSAETTRLHQEILRGEAAPPRLPRSLPNTKPMPLPPLVGRRPELETVSELLELLARGEGAVLGIEGGAGTGKTRLVQEILQAGRGRGYQVLVGNTPELEGRSPYTPFVEALRMALREDTAHAHLIPAELAAAIPELPPTAQPVGSADRLAAQNALFAGVLRFLAARAGDTPVVLVLDDLHFADEGSLKLFHYLARQVPSQGLLLVGTWRPRDPDSPPALETVLGDLERQSLLRRLALSPLSREEHHALFEQVLGGSVDGRLAGEVYRFSEGNPLFAGELARQLAADGQISLRDNVWRIVGRGALPIPSSLQTLFDRYVARLSLPPSLRTLFERYLGSISPAALQLLQLAATSGREVSFPVLEASAALEEGGGQTPLLDLLDEALEAQLLQETGLSYSFPHPLLREAVYQQMSEARRRALHDRVARALETLYGEDTDVPVEAIAFHHVRAGRMEQAVRYLVRAGDRAEAVYAHDDALLRYQEALSLLEGEATPETHRLISEVQERIGDVHRATGDVHGGVEAYRAALEALDRAGAGTAEEPRGTLHRKTALGAILTTDMPTAAEHLELARQTLGPDPLEEARVLIARALFDWHHNALEEAVQHALRALEIAEAAGSSVEVSQACEMLALTYLPLGDWEEGLKYELRREVAGWSPEVVVATDGHLCLWEYHVHGDEPYRRAQEFVEAVAEHAAGLGDLRCVAVCHYALGSMALLRGRPEEAAQSLEEALELNHRIGSPAGVAYTLARQASLRTVQGDAEAGWVLVRKGLETARQAAVWDHCLQRLCGTGIWNRLESGDLAGAEELVRTARELEEERRMCTVCSLQMHPALAAYYLATGEPDTAWEYAEKAREIAEMGNNRAGQAQVLRVRGEIHAARGEMDEAEECLSRATEAFQELGQRYDLEQTLQVRERLSAGAGSETQRGGRAGPGP
jgi:DNA-binding SARP family transcriptional activator